MDPNKMQQSTISKIRVLADSNMGAASVITSSGEAILSVLQQLEKFNIRGEKIWCLFKDFCDGDREKVTEFIINMKEQPTGYCCNGHDWGPSRNAKRTQCFATECKKEGQKYCGTCFSTRYCSRECQTVSWKDGHDKRCKQNVVNINKTVKKMGIQEASRRLYLLGLLSEQGVVQFMRKHHLA